MWTRTSVPIPDDSNTSDDDGDVEEIIVDPQAATTSQEAAIVVTEHSPNMENRKRQRFADSPTTGEETGPGP